MKPGNKGLYRVYKASIYSMQGIKAAWKHEAAFRQEVILMLLLTPTAFIVGAGLTQQLLLLALAWLIVIVEILNSAVEAVVDRFGGEMHTLSGRAKDMGSAAVFITLVLNGVVWGAVIGQNWLGLW
ncbi:MAG: diacylglycerol kinase [Gammaproteobacteria bacterium]|uniref:Diacylglycerol kinase n=2 Tax=Tolumonas osonensis TaxID=675874 RepID=A0A841GE02_9GAMM|nr:diacylglycerol kinase (ATP) [Tolumonas osonensis]NCB59859.1 diacylglycerol kinase [Gammaproteobacteria bacterium]